MKTRYRKRVVKPLPSRRKLAEALEKEHAAAVFFANKADDALGKVETLKSDAYYWKCGTETMQAENERLRLQLVELLPEDQFLSVRPWNGPQAPRYWRVPGQVMSIGVDIHVIEFEMKRRGVMQAYREAVAEDTARKVHAAMLEQFRVLEC
jgi:hypothetical protein